MDATLRKVVEEREREQAEAELDAEEARRDAKRARLVLIRESAERMMEMRRERQALAKAAAEHPVVDELADVGLSLTVGGADG